MRPRLYSMMFAACSLPAASVTPFAAHPEQIGDALLRHAHLARAEPVEREEEPPAQLLVHRVVPVAHRGLRHLRDQRLGEAQEQPLQRLAAVEASFHRPGAHAPAVPGDLHHRAARRDAAAHEERHPDHALPAGERDLGGGAVLQEVEQRHDAARGKVEVGLRPSRFVQRRPGGERHRLQGGREPLELGLGQRREKPVLPRVRDGGLPRVRHAPDGKSKIGVRALKS